MFPSPEVYGMIRRQHPDALLLFRHGGTIAVPEEHAPVVAGALGLGRLDISAPFVELPAIDTDRLVLALLVDGHRVAICEPRGVADQGGVREESRAFRALPSPEDCPAAPALRQLPLF